MGKGSQVRIPPKSPVRANAGHAADDRVPCSDRVVAECEDRVKNGSVPLPTLFRGDSLPPDVVSPGKPHRGRTFAERFPTEGLMAKFADQGRSVWAKLPLPMLVAHHIGYELGSEGADVSYHSPLLSFSPRREKAFEYSERRPGKRRRLIECPQHEATHFVWKLEGILATPAGRGHGLYAFEYEASSVNVAQYLNDARRRLVSGDRSALGPTLVQTIVHGHLDADKSPHQALLIDAVLYLASPACGDVPPTLRERARERAANAEEWLLFPCDPMPDGVGVSARFVPNKHISADMFLRLNEPEGSERDPAP